MNRVAKKYITNDSAIVAELTPQESGNPVASENSRPGNESFAPKETQSVPLPAWAKRTLNPLDVPMSKVNPTVSELPNGVRLIVQPETISGTVSIYGAVKNRPELEVPEGKEGVDQILDDLFSYGSTKLDRVAFQEALDEIAAEATTGTRFSLQVLADRFDRGTELLADNLLHPALPEAAFNAVKQRTRQAVAGRLQSPIYLSQRALLQAIFPGEDPTLRQATPETVSSLQLENMPLLITQGIAPGSHNHCRDRQGDTRAGKNRRGKIFWRMAGNRAKARDGSSSGAAQSDQNDSST